jgi:hypothetical protein
MTTKRRKDLPAVLATPIWLEGPWDDDTRAVRREALAKLPEVFAYYQVPPIGEDGARNDEELILALCQDLFPGFRRRYWDSETRGRPHDIAVAAQKKKLLEDVERVRASKPGWYDNAAISELVATDPAWKGENVRSLQNMLTEARKDRDKAEQARKEAETLARLSETLAVLKASHKK